MTKGLILPILFISNLLLSQDIQVAFVQFQGCEGTLAPEMIGLYTPCGVNIDDLGIFLDIGSAFDPNGINGNINLGGTCGWAIGELSVLPGCDLQASTPDGFVPPHSFIFVQMTAQPANNTFLANLCKEFSSAYVIRNSCDRTEEAFPDLQSGDTIQFSVLTPGTTQLITLYVAPNRVPVDFPVEYWFNWQGTQNRGTPSGGICGSTGGINIGSVIKPYLDIQNIEVVQPSCNSNYGSIRIEALGPIGAYSIDEGITWQSDSFYQNLDTGIYQVLVQDTAGTCPTGWKEPIEIIPYMNPMASGIWWQPTSDSTCSGQNGGIYIDATIGSFGSNGLEYSINGGITYSDSARFYGLIEGTYDIVIRDKANPQCADTAFWTSGPLTKPPEIIGLAKDSVGFCDNGRIEIEAFGNELLYSLDGVAYHLDSVVVLELNTPYTVYVKEVGNEHCIDSMEVTLYQAPEFVPEVNVNGQSAEFFLLFESKGPYRLLWSTGDTTRTVDNLPIGFNYLDITDGWGCSQRYAFFIQENTCLFQITDSIVDATCETPTTSIYLNNMDTLNTYTYDWSEDNFDGQPYVENVPHGTYTVEISYGDCSKKIEFTTPIGGIERVDISTRAAGCTGIGNIILEKVTGGQGPFTIDITGEQFDSSLQIMGLSSGIYPLLITDIKGCQFRDTVEIISNASIPVVTPKARVDCETSIYSLDFSEIEGGSSPYKLIFEGDIAPDFLIENLLPGTYQYEIFDSSGCHSGIDEIYLFEIPEVMIANRDTFIIPGDPIFLSAHVDTGILRNFEWMNVYGDICDYCLDILYENAEEGTYFFTYDYKLIDGSPCEKTYRFRVRYLQDNIYIPNAFSPDGNDVNDLFDIYAPNHDILSMQIYNRWGDKIFSSTGPDFQWNGQIGSIKAEQGVYIYHVLLRGTNGESVHKSGSITLIR